MPTSTLTFLVTNTAVSVSVSVLRKDFLILWGWVCSVFRCWFWLFRSEFLIWFSLGFGGGCYLILEEAEFLNSGGKGGETTI